MLNPTQKALAALAWKFLVQHAADDPELAFRTQDCQTQWDAFRRTHRHNRPLIRDAGNLLDAESLLGEIRGEYQFFLGLQMGLELGRLDMFPEF